MSPWAAAIWLGGPLNGSKTAQIRPDSPGRLTFTTQAAVAAGEDSSRTPGGVDESWVSFAADHGDTDPSGLFQTNTNKNRTT